MRFSIKTLLIMTSLVAAACAAIFYPNVYWTTAFYTASLGMIMLAAVAAAICRGPVRAYWIGFVIFSGIYFWAAFTDLQAHYRNEYTFRLITTVMLDRVDQWLSVQRPGRGANFAFPNLEVTMPIGHAVFAMVAGLIGGAVADWLYRRQEPR